MTIPKNYGTALLLIIREHTPVPAAGTVSGQIIMKPEDAAGIFRVRHLWRVQQ